eukprot:COSAG02_NODE_8730_length_2460_cov_220.264718_2_plen_115_part_00
MAGSGGAELGGSLVPFGAVPGLRCSAFSLALASLAASRAAGFLLLAELLLLLFVAALRYYHSRLEHIMKASIKLLNELNGPRTLEIGLLSQRFTTLVAVWFGRALRRASCGASN